MARKTNYKYSQGGIDDLLAGLVRMEKSMPEINRAAVALIARRALKIAQDKLNHGDSSWADHSEYTEELTKKLRGGDTKWVMNEDGDLAKSLRITMNTVAMGQIHVEIGSDLVYAAILEYGGHPFGAVGPPQTGFIPPRPYLRPAIEEAIYEHCDDIEGKLARAYEIALEGGNWRGVFS